MADERTAEPAPASGEHPVPSTGVALRARYVLSRVLFVLVYGVFGLRRRTIRENLARSFPGQDARALRALRREFIARQSEILAEIDYARRIEAEELRVRVRLVNPEVLGNAQAPRPAIFAAAHQCNFEWLLLRVSLELGDALLALYKPLRRARAEAYFHKVRTRFGTRLVPAKSVLRELARFREARGIGLVADQVPRSSPEKHWVEFLHQPTAFYMGPELLARALRSNAYYVSMRRLMRGQYEIEFVPLNAPAEKAATGTITERYARALERDIQDDPAGWWWSHRRWKIKRPEAGNG
jgi:KDO2-lipid IV(A) lauroyltransferase